MTEPGRDEMVSRRYRELPAEEPPRALDDAILAAARREVRARPAPLVAPTGRRRWYVPVAAAAVIVLAVAVTLRIQLEQPDLETLPETRAPQPVQAPAAEPAKPPPETLAKSAESQLYAQKSAPERRAPASAEQAKPAGEPKTFVPDPAPSAAPPPAAETELSSRSAPAAAGAPAMKSMPMQRSDDVARDRAERAPAGTISAQRMQEAEETPERALERIAELRKAGKHDEADKALAEFRKRYPEYRLPEAMRERVERR